MGYSSKTRKDLKPASDGQVQYAKMRVDGNLTPKFQGWEFRVPVGNN